MSFLVLGATVLLLAYANGANDNFKPTATVYGADTLNYRGALRLATAAQLAGSLASVFVAGALLKAFGGKGLVPDATVANVEFLMAVGLAAAGTVLVATRVGLPISTTHALIGGLIGAGLAFAPRDIAWGALSGRYFMPLLVSPALAVSVTAALYPLARRTRKALGIEASSRVHLESIKPLAAATGDLNIPLRYDGSVLGISAQEIADKLHVASAFALGFARGLNDTPKILGVLVAVEIAGLHGQMSLVTVAAAMAMGGLIHSPRLAQTMGKSITTMNTGQGLLANAISSALVISASLIGSPVSTTHVSNGAIFGIGIWTGRANWRLISGIVAAWVGTLPIACALSYGIGLVLRSV